MRQLSVDHVNMIWQRLKKDAGCPYHISNDVLNQSSRLGNLWLCTPVLQTLYSLEGLFLYDLRAESRVHITVIITYKMASDVLPILG